MSHRADRIVDAIVSAIQGACPSSIRVYAHRRLTLSEDESQLPAISVDFGEDVPVNDDQGAYLMDGSLQSLLTVNITGIAVSVDEASIRRSLLDMRSLVHIGIKGNSNLGLPFVIDTHYGGANPPEVDISSDKLVGELTSAWGVRYEMNLLSPE